VIERQLQVSALRKQLQNTSCERRHCASSSKIRAASVGIARVAPKEEVTRSTSCCRATRTAHHAIGIITGVLGRMTS
jgi:hypothetical protein